MRFSDKQLSLIRDAGSLIGNNKKNKTEIKLDEKQNKKTDYIRAITNKGKKKANNSSVLDPDGKRENFYNNFKSYFEENEAKKNKKKSIFDYEDDDGLLG